VAKVVTSALGKVEATVSQFQLPGEHFGEFPRVSGTLLVGYRLGGDLTGPAEGRGLLRFERSPAPRGLRFLAGKTFGLLAEGMVENTKEGKCLARLTLLIVPKSIVRHVFFNVRGEGSATADRCCKELGPAGIISLAQNALQEMRPRVRFGLFGLTLGSVDLSGREAEEPARPVQ